MDLRRHGCSLCSSCQRAFIADGKVNLGFMNLGTKVEKGAAMSRTSINEALAAIVISLGRDRLNFVVLASYLRNTRSSTSVTKTSLAVSPGLYEIRGASKVMPQSHTRPGWGWDSHEEVQSGSEPSGEQDYGEKRVQELGQGAVKRSCFHFALKMCYENDREESSD
eukprot:1183751-Prorocentrum_minimum.AAC.8